MTEINRKVWFSVSLPACLDDSNNPKTPDWNTVDGLWLRAGVANEVCVEVVGIGGADMHTLEEGWEWGGVGQGSPCNYTSHQKSE